MKLLSTTSSRAVLAAAVILGLGATGAAVAASSSSSTTVHACYAKKGGDLRRVGSATACKGSERALAWNKRGPAGQRGPAGPAGSARAYAAVNGNATLVDARSKNVLSVSNFGTGSYCVFLDPSIDVSTTVSLVSLTGGAGSSDTAVYTSTGTCSQGSGADEVAGVYVKTTTLAGVDKAAPFYLMVP